MQEATYIFFIYACRNGCILHSAITVHFHSGLWYICVLEHLRVGGKIALQNLCFENLTLLFPHSQLCQEFLFSRYCSHKILFPEGTLNLLKIKNLLFLTWKSVPNFFFGENPYFAFFWMDALPLDVFRTSTFLKCHFEIHKSYLYKWLTISSIAKEETSYLSI